MQMVITSNVKAITDAIIAVLKFACYIGLLWILTAVSLTGHSPADYKLLSAQVMIRHGDRYPLYSIPKTKRPAIDCTLSTSRYTGFLQKI